MVNTFLIDENFRESARKLNPQRLGKQRVEAYQILIALQQLRFLANYFGVDDYPIDEDTPKTQRESWITKVLDEFKKSGLASIHITHKLIIEIPYSQPLPKKIKNGHELYYNPDNGLYYEVKGKRNKIVSSGKRYEYVLPGEELITTGFRKHPAVCMWLGFETALKDYINAHIEVWVERGYKNTMETYTVPDDYKRPSWSYSKDIINNFKSTLVERELDRLETFWFSLQEDMVKVYTQTEKNFRQFQILLKSLPPPQPKTDANGNKVYNTKGEPMYVESDLHNEYKPILHGLGYWSHFIWP